MKKYKEVITLAIAVTLLVSMPGCKDNSVASGDDSGISEAGTKLKTDVELIELPDELTYVSDIHIDDDGVLLVSGGIVHDELNLDGVIWKQNGNSWDKVFSRSFSETMGHPEPLISFLDETSAVLEYNNWNMDEMKEYSTECFYIPDYYEDAVEPVFSGNQNSGNVARGAYPGKTGYSIGYDYTEYGISLPNLYKVDIPDNSIEKVVENMTINPYKIFAYDGGIYINAAANIYELDQENNKLNALDEWNGIKLEERIDTGGYEVERPPYVIFTNDSVIYMGSNSLRMANEKSTVEYDVKGVEPFTDNYIIEDHLLADDGIYLFYYDRSSEDSKLCKVTL